jgi:hypothetical protein
VNSSPGLGVNDFSHSCIKWLAVFRKEPADLFSAGHGAGSRLTGVNGSHVVLVLVRGLTSTVEGLVLASDVTLEEERDGSGLSSQASQLSLDTSERLLVEDDFVCLDATDFLVVVGTVW